MNKKILPIFLAFLFVFAVFAISQTILAQNSPDAIAIRIMSNPRHMSPLRWYQDQGFNGAPQNITVDGYDAIRDGNTVYVNTAHVIDAVPPSSTATLYTNVFVLTTSVGSDNQTQEIFNRIITNFKFNTNLTDEVGEYGNCLQKVTSTAPETSNTCLSTGECTDKLVCTSRKARTIRDVKRLADLDYLNYLLSDYKNKHGNKCPEFDAGSYEPRRTISTWNSWQNGLGIYLGAKLPMDPVNQLGQCELDEALNLKYDPSTCWDVANKKFSTSTPKNQLRKNLPADSFVYTYSVSESGMQCGFYMQFETGLTCNSIGKCGVLDENNHAPIFTATSFNGQTRQEFNGYATAFDEDGDILTFKAVLLEPVNESTWLASPNKWVWDPGFSGPKIFTMPNPNQRRFHMVKAGKAKFSNHDRLRLFVSDGRGKSNSTTSIDVNLQIAGVPMTVTNPAVKTITIGQATDLVIAATDSSLDPINTFSFDSAEYNKNSSTTLNISDLSLRGFDLVPSALKLSEFYEPGQKTGNYRVAVSFLDTLTLKSIKGYFGVNVINNPPIFDSAKVTFGNGTETDCLISSGVCDVAIDNLENAKIQVAAHDNDPGHNVTYGFKSPVPLGLNIDSVTGLITGFENLNAHGLLQTTTSFKVVASDQHCMNSSSEECSVEYGFNVSVMPYCNINEASSTLKGGDATVYKKYNNDIVYENIANLKNCSAAKAYTDVKYNGEARSKSIVVVSDLSDSMNNRTPTAASPKAIDSLKDAIKNANGLIDRLYNIATQLPTSHAITIGTVAFNSNVKDFTGMDNILGAGVVTNNVLHVTSYATNYQTNTLSGLNKAESLLLSEPVVADKDRVVILISDGKPVVSTTQVLPGAECVSYEVCNQCGTLGSCFGYGTASCAAGETACWCSCYPTDKPAYCGADCSYSCGSCSCPSEPSEPCVPIKDCTGECNCNNGCGWITPPCSSRGNNVNLDYFSMLKNFFSPLQVNAITNQSQCLSTECPAVTCPACVTTVADSYCGSYFNCSVQFDPNCSIEADTNVEASALKNILNAKIYSVYFDTQHNNSGKSEMMNWSSDNGSPAGQYFFGGSNISEMLDNVLKDIVIKPKNLKIGDTTLVDTEPFSIANTTLQEKIEIGDMCKADYNGFKITYDGSGTVNVQASNLKYEYCPVKLHP